MEEQFSRTVKLIGKDGLAKLAKARVLVVGIGGVGGYAVEALTRSGVGALTLIDGDKYCLSNLNRQLFATHSTLGAFKAEVAQARIADINPRCKTEIFNCFYTPENASTFDLSKYDYIIDAIDSVKNKIELIKNAQKVNTPIISCMGAGNRLDATALTVDDIYKTKGCPLAKVMRRLCSKNGIEKLRVVYSKEEALEPKEDKENRAPGSVAFVPAVAGMILAGEAVKHILNMCD
ncbi:MAG: tRNA threonylcarbamoyladenosine dehydratase [Christensenellales bacterium]|jgi:tRNA A37 threonylcarbamoyladenosine dehydratase